MQSARFGVGRRWPRLNENAPPAQGDSFPIPPGQLRPYHPFIIVPDRKGAAVRSSIFDHTLQEQQSAQCWILQSAKMLRVVMGLEVIATQGRWSPMADIKQDCIPGLCQVGVAGGHGIECVRAC